MIADPTYSLQSLTYNGASGFSQKQFDSINQLVIKKKTQTNIPQTKSIFMYDQRLYFIGLNENHFQIQAPVKRIKVHSNVGYLEFTSYKVDKKQVTQQWFKIKNFESILQEYSINVDQSTVISQMQPVVQPPVAQNNDQVRIASSTIIPIQSKKLSVKSKPILYFPHQLKNMAFCRDIQNDNIMYLFGGVQHSGQKHSDKLWKIDFLAKNLQLMEQFVHIPEPRQGASMIYYHKTIQNIQVRFLALYGGYSLETSFIYNQFYMYNLSNRVWTMLFGDFQNLLSPRLSSSFTHNPFTDTFYLFGGIQYDTMNDQHLLNDFYQIRLNYEEQDFSKINRENRKVRMQVQTKIILRQQFKEWPSKRTNHLMTWLNKDIMIVIGGQGHQYHDKVDDQKTMNGQEKIGQQNQLQNIFPIKLCQLNDIWLFNVKTRLWTQIIRQDFDELSNLNGSFALQLLKIKEKSSYDLILLCRNQIQDKSGHTQIYKISIWLNEYESQLNQQSDLIATAGKKKHTESKQLTCDLCGRIQQSQKANSSLFRRQLFNPEITFPVSYVDQFILAGLTSPFQAIGLLTQLSTQHDANSFSISFQFSITSQNYNPFIQFEDNGQVPYTIQELFSCISIFSIHQGTETINVNDKKYKMMQTRRRSVKQYCNRLKIAALRLGQQFVWIGATSNSEIPIVWIRKENRKIENSQQSDKPFIQNQWNSSDSYAINYTALDFNSLEVLPDHDIDCFKLIKKKFPQIVQRFSTGKKSLGSLLHITKLRKIPQFSESNVFLSYQLIPLLSENTLILNNGTADMLRYLSQQRSTQKNRCKLSQQQKLKITDGIEFSLKPYLSMLYLNRNMKIWLKVFAKGEAEKSKKERQDAIEFNKQKQIELPVVKVQKGSEDKNENRNHNFVNQVRKVMQSLVQQSSPQKEAIKSVYPHLFKEPLIVSKKEVPKMSQILKNTSKQLTYPLRNGEIVQNKYEQITPQFMLMKIDQLIEKGEVMEIDTDAFEGLDCKIVEIYCWEVDGKPKSSQVISKRVGKEKKNHEQQDKTEQTFLYPNGLLLYHKNKLIMRYDQGIPFESDTFKSDEQDLTPEENKDQKIRIDKSSRTFPLFGVIEVSSKLVQNVFGNDFYDEWKIQRPLQKLYEKIEYVAMLRRKIDSKKFKNRANKPKIEIEGDGPKRNSSIVVEPVQVETNLGRKKLKEDNEKNIN